MTMAHWPRESLSIWMHNANAEIQWLGAQQIAVTQTNAQRSTDATYLTSLRSGWFDYAAEELGSNRFASLGVRILGRVAQFAGLDRLVLLDNLPISTNEHLACNTVEIAQLSQVLSELHPDHFIGVRNVLPHKNADLMRELKQQGFVSLPARVIYEFDLRQEPSKKPSHLMRDFSALKKSSFESCVLNEISNLQANQLRQLYQSIYIEKHSALNPQYSSQFFSDMLQSQVMRCLLLRDYNQDVRAFAMLYQVGDTLTVPALGYDRALENIGLYRMLFASIYQYALNSKLLLNYSSGAGDFKRKRGATPHLEYTLLRAPLRYRLWQKKWLRWIETQTATLGASDLIALGA